MEYRLIELGKKHLLTTSDGKVNYLKEATELLAGLHSPLERDVYLGRLAADLQVSKTALQSQLDYQIKRRQKQQQDKQFTQVIRNAEASTQKANPDAKAHVRGAGAEESLIGAILLNPDYMTAVEPLLSPDEMITPFNRKVYEQLLMRYRQGYGIELSFLSELYDPDEMAYITKMVRDAREHVSSLTVEEAKRYVSVIKSENQLAALRNPEDLTPEQIQEKLKAMKQMKQ